MSDFPPAPLPEPPASEAADPVRRGPTDPLPPDIRAAVEAATTARVFLPGGPTAYDTASWLQLRADHAAARDAVHGELDLDGPALVGLIRRYGALVVGTAAPDTAAYLTRPDLGRRLSPSSARAVDARLGALRSDEPTVALGPPWRAAGDGAPAELAVALGDGMSATALQTYGPRLLDAIVDGAASRGWRVQPPVVVVRRCRVGILNDLGPRLGAQVLILLVGERPGLAAADSLSAYLGYRPGPGHTDADRNLVSGIHDRGTPVDDAGRRVLALAGRLLAARRSGVAVKEEPAATPDLALPGAPD